MKHHTLESVDQQLLTYFKETGKRPTAKTHASLNVWLRYHKQSSVTERCSQLGILKRSRVLPLARTLAEVDAALKAFFEATGKIPSARTHAYLYEWLKKHHQTTVTERCAAINICHTMASVDQQILTYFKKFGRRPLYIQLGVCEFLKQNNNTLAQRCDFLQLPLDNKYTIEDIDQTLWAHFKETGRRPHARKYCGISRFLRMHQSSVSKRCDFLQIPGGPRKYTIADIDQQLLAYFKETGYRPTAYTHNNLNTWCYSNGTTLTKRCDELNIPKNFPSKDARPKIRSSYKVAK